MAEGFPRPVVRPPSYSARRLVWVVSEEPATAGLAILVPAGIPIAELKQFREQYDKIADELEAWPNLSAEEREGKPDPSDLMLQLVSPYIEDWNVTVPDADGGEPVPVAPPKEAGADVLRAITQAELGWIVRRIRNGLYLGNGFAKTWSGESGGTPPTS